MSELLAAAHQNLTVLELKPGATWQDVKRSYRFLVQIWHPDRFSAGSETQSQAGERLKAINEAYDWLCEHQALVSALATEQEPQAQRDPTTAEGAETYRRQQGARSRSASYPPPRSPLTAPEQTRNRQRRWLWGAAGATALITFVVAVATSSDSDPARRTLSRRSPPPSAMAPSIDRDDRSPDPTPREYFVEAKHLYVTANRLNVRESPTTESRILTALNRGDRVEIDAAEGLWRRIATGDPTRDAGWVHSAYLTTERQLAASGDTTPRPERPYLSGLTASERRMVESACSIEKNFEGPVAYHGCVQRQLIGLSRDAGRPDLSGLTSSEKRMVESACRVEKSFEGPAAYYGCLRRQLSLKRFGLQ